MDDEDTLLPRKLQAALEQALERKNDLINQDSDSESDEGKRTNPVSGRLLWGGCPWKPEKKIMLPVYWCASQQRWFSTVFLSCHDRRTMFICIEGSRCGTFPCISLWFLCNFFLPRMHYAANPHRLLGARNPQLLWWFLPPYFVAFLCISTVSPSPLAMWSMNRSLNAWQANKSSPDSQDMLFFFFLIRWMCLSSNTSREIRHTNRYRAPVCSC